MTNPETVNFTDVPNDKKPAGGENSTKAGGSFISRNAKAIGVTFLLAIGGALGYGSATLLTSMKKKNETPAID